MEEQTFFSKNCFFVIFIMLINVANFTFAQNHVIIKRNGYKGYLRLIDRTNSVLLKECIGGEKDEYIDLPARLTNIEIETGANLPDQSFFNFKINTDGTIDPESIIPKESAFIKTERPNSLELNTKLITIDPGRYKFYYQFSALRDSTILNHPAVKIKGKLSCYVVTGLKYTIDNGTNNQLIVKYFSENESCNPKKDSVISTAFSFRMLANDTIQTDNPIATKITHGNVLTFRTVCVKIDPKQISGGIPITYQEQIVRRKQTLQLIPSLATRLNWQTKECKNAQFFIPL